MPEQDVTESKKSAIDAASNPFAEIDPHDLSASRLNLGNFRAAIHHANGRPHHEGPFAGIAHRIGELSEQFWGYMDLRHYDAWYVPISFKGSRPEGLSIGNQTIGSIEGKKVLAVDGKVIGFLNYSFQPEEQQDAVHNLIVIIPFGMRKREKA